MAELHDIIAYLLRESPRREGLPNARLTKMVYLADWRHAITRGAQVSGISWVFDHFGPFVWDIANAARQYPALFTVTNGETAYGNPKLSIGLADRKYDPGPRLGLEERASLDHVVRTTSMLTFDEFVRLVYSTYPIRTAPKYSPLDLIRLAVDYQRAEG